MSRFMHLNLVAAEAPASTTNLKMGIFMVIAIALFHPAPAHMLNGARGMGCYW